VWLTAIAGTRDLATSAVDSTTTVGAELDVLPINALTHHHVALLADALTDDAVHHPSPFV
jgi:hypothetical protein